MRLYRLAAKQGDAGSMFNLAMNVSVVVRGEKDPVLAVMWMRHSAEHGYTEALGQLGAWYILGEGGPLPANYKVALRFLRLAADKDLSSAFANLGVLFENGLGVPRDLDEACRLFRQAATLGYEPAKDYLRRLAQQGHAPSAAALRELGLGSL